MKRMLKLVKPYIGAIVIFALLSACTSKHEKMVQFYYKGLSYYEHQDYVNARLAIKNAIQIDPKYAQAYELLGKVELADKDYQKAYGYFAKSVELDPDLIDAQLELGNLLLAARQIDKAREKADLLLSKEPKNQNALCLHAGLQIAQGDSTEAARVLKALITDGFTDPQAFIWLSAIRMKEKNWPDAKKILEEGMKVNPNDLEIRGVTALQLIEHKEMDKAIEVVREMIQLDSETINHQLQLATLLWAQGKQEEAENMLVHIVDKDPANDKNRLEVIRFYSMRRQMQKAFDLLNTGIKDNPKSYKLRLALSRLYMGVHESDKAISTATDCLKLSKDQSDPNILEAKNLLASLYMSLGEIKKATEYADQVVAESPKNVDAQFLRGRIYLRNGDGLNAVSAFRMVTGERPEDPKANLYLAQAHIVNQEKKLALDTLVAAVKANPRNVLLRKALARMYAAEKDFESAQKELKVIIANKPKDPRARGDMIDFLLSFNRYSEAEVFCREMIDIWPDLPAGYLKMARTYALQKQLEKALEVLKTGHSRLPNAAELLTSLVKVELAAGQKDQALQSARTFIQNNPKSPFGQNLLGEIYVSQRQYSKAEKQFQAAIALRPEWQPPHNNLARTYLTQGKKAEAIGNLAEALETNPKNAMAYITLGFIYQQSGDLSKAIETYERALSNIPTLWAAANNLAFILTDEFDNPDSIQRAIELAQRATELKPGESSIQDTLGWAYFKQGKTDLAIDEFEKAIAQSPDSPVINYHLAMAFLQTNRMAEAREYLEKAVAGDESFPGKKQAQKELEKLKAG